MSDYRKQLTWAKARVGLVVTAALVVIFFAVLLAGNLGNLFSPHVTIYATFADVKGLQQGAPVWFSGVQIGTVGSIEFSGARIRVPLSVKRDILPYIKQDSPAGIQTLGLLGDKYVEIGPGTPQSPGLKPGGIISAAPTAAISGDLYRDLADSVKDIKTFAASIKNSGGTLDKLIKDPALYERFLKASQSLDTFTKKLAVSKGTMNRLLEDESLYNNLNTAALNLNLLLNSINTGQGTIGRLVADGDLSQDLQTTLREVNGLVKDIKENPKKYFSFSLL